MQSHAPRHRTRTIAVIGAGVVGLTCALELARAQFAVTVVADAAAEDSVSGVAGGIWFPHQSEDSPRAVRLLNDSFLAFRELAHSTPEAGVDLREGVWVRRDGEPEDSWIDALGAVTEGGPAGRDAVEELGEGERPEGSEFAVRAVLPIVDMPTYLPWLRERCREAGVRFVEASVDTVAHAASAGAWDGLPADLVVVAAGGRSGELLGDKSGYPVRGQVVRLAQPAEPQRRITQWYVDDAHRDGMIYVIPRRGDIVVGGTDDVGATGTLVDQATGEAILDRAVAAVPGLAGLGIDSGAVGLRPARPSLRIESVTGYPVPVVAAYGHGGAGVTLSWGTAGEVAQLVAASTSSQ